MLKNLDHPGIPLVYDLEEDADYFYLIEEYLEGCSLYALIKDQGTLQEDLAVRYGLQICSLVEYLSRCFLRGGHGAEESRSSGDSAGL